MNILTRTRLLVYLAETMNKLALATKIRRQADESNKKKAESAFIQLKPLMGNFN